MGSKKVMNQFDRGRVFKRVPITVSVGAYSAVHSVNPRTSKNQKL